MPELLRIWLFSLVLTGMIACHLAAQTVSAARADREPNSTIKLVTARESKQSKATGGDGPAAEQLPELFSGNASTNSLLGDGTEIAADSPPESLDEYAPGYSNARPPNDDHDGSVSPWNWLGLRYYSKDGRNAGMGVPLVGTSWLNRPYYAGIELGPVWITDPPQADISHDVDLLGGLYIGDDWDYYWGTELAVERATPELTNSKKPHAERGDRMMIWTANMLYYPWGDSLYRPYWRCGVGAMEIDYVKDDGNRHDEALWAFPVGVGIKYPFRRWLAVRAEVGDTIGVGNSGVAAQHDWSLSFALEWRFGAHPKSYWPWNPSRHIW